MWNSVISWLSIIIGIAGLIIALYQFKEKKKLERIIRAENWFNYERANNSSGTLQKAIRIYKEKHRNNIDSEVMELLSQADIFGQETYMSFIRQIHMIEPKFNDDCIRIWEMEGKLTSEKAKLFRKFIVENTKEKSKSSLQADQ